jgi:hypothetical protein
MSDIVEDSKIHFIVKDYKRMYDGFHALVEENKALKEMLEKKEQAIANLEAFKRQKITKSVVVQEKKLDGTIKGRLNECLCQARSLNDKAKKIIEQSERLMNTIGELDNQIRK